MARGERVKGRTWFDPMSIPFIFSEFLIPDPTYLITQRPSCILRSHHHIYLRSDPMHQDCIHMVHPLKIAIQNPTQDNWANKLGLGIFRQHPPQTASHNQAHLFEFLYSFYLFFF